MTSNRIAVYTTNKHIQNTNDCTNSSKHCGRLFFDLWHSLRIIVLGEKFGSSLTFVIIVHRLRYNKLGKLKHSYRRQIFIGITNYPLVACALLFIRCCEWWLDPHIHRVHTIHMRQFGLCCTACFIVNV